MTKDFRGELGQLTQVGERHFYPLVGVHAQTFIANRFALIGDAATNSAKTVSQYPAPVSTPLAPMLLKYPALSVPN
jgi:hypothetical protein